MSESDVQVKGDCTSCIWILAWKVFTCKRTFLHRCFYSSATQLTAPVHECRSHFWASLFKGAGNSFIGNQSTPLTQFLKGFCEACSELQTLSPTKTSKQASFTGSPDISAQHDLHCRDAFIEQEHFFCLPQCYTESAGQNPASTWQRISSSVA